MCGVQPSALRDILNPPPLGELLNLPRLGSQPIADISITDTPPCLMSDAELAQAIENLPEKD